MGLVLTFSISISHFMSHKHMTQEKHVSFWRKHQLLSDYGIPASKHTRVIRQ